MALNHRRTPRNYDSTGTTTHHLSKLLPTMVQHIQKTHCYRPDLVLAAWPEIIGPQIAAMTFAVSFVEGVLTVKVMNSTLHSLLSRNDKPRILARFKQKFPTIEVKNIIFRIG